VHPGVTSGMTGNLAAEITLGEDLLATKRDDKT